jgi:hypothetical protein
MGGVRLDRPAVAAFPDRRPRLVGPVTSPVNPDEVRCYLGYPEGASPGGRVEDLLGRWVAEAGARAAARATYAVFPVADSGRRWVRAETPRGPVEFRGAVGEFLGPAEWLAVFIATAGPDVERLAADLLHRGDRLAGLVVNAVGAERAEAAEAAVVHELTARARPAGLGLTLPYSPGYCGMALTEQRSVFAAVDGSAVGVTLTPDCLMVPLKSVSGLIGLGPAGLVAGHGSPCDRCELYHCAMRRGRTAAPLSRGPGAGAG